MEAEVTVTLPTGASETFTLLPNVAVNRTYDKALELAQYDYALPQQKGIEVKSSREIAVSGASMAPFSGDAFLALPVDVLGQAYVVLSQTAGRDGDTAYFQMIAVADDTIITFVPKVDLKSTPVIASGTTVQTVLQNGQSITFAADGVDDDISGTLIQGNKAFVLFSGHRCARVPDSSVNFCDHLVEQLPPLSALGKSFVLVPFAERTGGDFVRVVTTVDDTIIQKNGVEITPSGGAAAHSIVSFNLASTEFAVLQSSSPILVMQLLKSETAENSLISSDPAMTAVPPVAQWANSFVFAPVVWQSSYGSQTKHYVSIVVAAGQTAGVRLDGNPIATSDWTVLPDGKYASHVQTIEAGAHTLHHISINVGMQLMMYGLGGSADPEMSVSYAFPGGQRVAPLGEFCVKSLSVVDDGLDNDCDDLVDEELLNGIDDDGDGRIDEDIATGGDIIVCPDVKQEVVPSAGQTVTITGNGNCLCLEFPQ